MKYMIFQYNLSDADGREVEPDKHYLVFHHSTGRDEFGQFAEYRGTKNSVLMHLRTFSKDFSGLVGRHSDEREVTDYFEETDETTSIVVPDHDYPNTPFICMPRLRTIACVEGSQITANAAMARLHQILSHRSGHLLTYGPLREALDLRKAVRRFRLTEVSFEVLPVNPHTGPLGKRLDQARAQDHIKRIVGKVEGKKSEPLKLDGGFLTEIQQLQQSGHAKAGYKGYTDNDVVVSVSKPKETHELSEDEEQTVHGEEVDIKIEFPGVRIQYPFHDGHFTQLRTIVRRLTDRIEDGQ